MEEEEEEEGGANAAAAEEEEKKGDEYENDSSDEEVRPGVFLGFECSASFPRARLIIFRFITSLSRRLV